METELLARHAPRERDATRTARKLRIERRFSWPHHRTSWSWVESAIERELVAEKAATVFVSAIETALREGPIGEPWIGISHQVLEAPPALFRLYGGKRFDLRGIEDRLRASLPHCRGIFALSEHMAGELRPLLGEAAPVESLWHPTPLDVPAFRWEAFRANPEPQIIQLGHWRRRFHAIFDLPVRGYRKTWLPGRELDIARALQIEGELAAVTPDVAVYERLPDDEYDERLSRNLAFVPLYDASACNSILECIARATPLLVEPLPAVVEYLGAGYPLYFDTLEDAARKAEDLGALRAAHLYLADLPKRRFSSGYFVESVRSSRIYQALPEEERA